jgi:hypothetical protein
MITGSLVAHVKTPIGNGTIEVNDRDVILTTKKVLVDKKEKSKIIPIKYIAKVEFKRPGITPGHLKIWYSSGKLMISSYTTRQRNEFSVN